MILTFGDIQNQCSLVHPCLFSDIGLDLPDIRVPSPVTKHCHPSPAYLALLAHAPLCRKRLRTELCLYQLSASSQLSILLCNSSCGKPFIHSFLRMHRASSESHRLPGTKNRGRGPSFGGTQTSEPGVTWHRIGTLADSRSGHFYSAS